MVLFLMWRLELMPRLCYDLRLRILINLTCKRGVCILYARKNVFTWNVNKELQIYYTLMTHSLPLSQTNFAAVSAPWLALIAKFKGTFTGPWQLSPACCTLTQQHYICSKHDVNCMSMHVYQMTPKSGKKNENDVRKSGHRTRTVGTCCNDEPKDALPQITDVRILQRRTDAMVF